MAANGLPDMVRRLRRLADPQATGVSDAELLDRYSRTRDEAAFELLLWRHGPMVHGVCRRLLRRAEDAEDAFQATFLTLVRKAATIRQGASLGAWLYQVAYRVALRARARTAPDDGPVAEPESVATCAEVEWQDLGPVLDEEVRRLPARYRDPVILCYLEGRTHAEAARELRCPKGTVAIRLSRARKLLQTRLSRRGITLAGGLQLIRPAPPAVVNRTLRLACGGPVPVQVTNLTEGAIRAMSLSRYKAMAIVIVASAGLLAAGVSVSSRAMPPTPEQPAQAGEPKAAAGERKAVVVRVPALRDGALVMIGTEIAPGENVPADRRISVPVGFLVVAVKKGESVKAEDEIKDTGNPRWRRWHEGEPIPPGKIEVRRATIECKRLDVGDEVKAGHLVGLVDPSLSLGELKIKVAALAAADAAVRATEKTKEEAERRVKAMEESTRRVPGSVSNDDYQGARLTAARYAEECVAARAAVTKTQQEVAYAHSILKLHEIRSPVSGVITAVEREPGEPVKVLDTVIKVTVARKNVPTGPGAIQEKEKLVRGVHDGVLLQFCTRESAGDARQAGPAYRPLHPGDTVEAGALIARLDDTLARHDCDLKATQLDAFRSESRARQRVKEEAERRVSSMEESLRKVPGSVSKDDYEAARLTASRSREEELSALARVTVAEAELERARILLSTYEIRSPVRGVIREFLQVPGEAVRSGQPLIRLAVQGR